MQGREETFTVKSKNAGNVRRKAANGKRDGQALSHIAASLPGDKADILPFRECSCGP